jgi:hypothetical protein
MTTNTTTGTPKNPVASRNQRRANEVAWELYKNSIVSTWGEALSLGWKIRNAKKVLRKGVCSFSYKTAKGDTRPATGTLNAGLYPGFEQKTELTTKAKKVHIVSYWDTGKEAWRSFDIRNIIALPQLA